MKSSVIYILLLIILTSACQNPSYSTDKQIIMMNKKYEKPVSNLISFFQENAFDPELKTYFSEIDNKGEIVSEKVYNVALSRMIFGLSYASSLNKSNLGNAIKSYEFQIKHLTLKDSTGHYFASFHDIGINENDSSAVLDIWQQAYGLCGLSELYKHYPNEELLSQIHKLHGDFTKRFHDPINGGFYGNYNRQTGTVSGSKSLQSLMYPITSYMENLWLVDTENRSKYESYLKENLTIAYKRAWNDNLGWVNIKFDDAWNPCQHLSSEKPCFTVTPGHNFQLASLFLRTKTWDFLSDKEKKMYYDLGNKILDTTLNKTIFPTKDLSQGIYSEVNPVSNKIIDYRKTWWQHCEAIISLSLAGEDYNEKLKSLEKFYFNSFIDKDNGGEFFYLDKNSNPQTKELKGSIGKALYHTLEMTRYLSYSEKE